MARYWQAAVVAWILVVVPCTVVISAIVMAGRPSISVLAIGLALYLSAMLVWIVHRYNQRNLDKEQCEVPRPDEEDPSNVNTTKTPSCILTMPNLAAVPSSDDPTPPPYDLVQALAQAPNSEAIVRVPCQKAIGGTCREGCPWCGTQAASSFDESALPTYSELVASGAIPSSDKS